MTPLWRVVFVVVVAVGFSGCKSKSVTTASRSLPTVLGQETLDLPPAQQAERQADVLGYLLKSPSDYAREAEIEIDEDNVEDELAKIRAELSHPSPP
jgi:hypothetical protein